MAFRRGLVFAATMGSVAAERISMEELMGDARVHQVHHHNASNPGTGVGTVLCCMKGVDFDSVDKQTAPLGVPNVEVRIELSADTHWNDHLEDCDLVTIARDGCQGKGRMDHHNSKECGTTCAQDMMMQPRYWAHIYDLWKKKLGKDYDKYAQVQNNYGESMTITRKYNLATTYEAKVQAELNAKQNAKSQKDKQVEDLEAKLKRAKEEQKVLAKEVQAKQSEFAKLVKNIADIKTAKDIVGEAGGGPQLQLASKRALKAIQLRQEDPRKANAMENRDSLIPQGCEGEKIVDFAGLTEMQAAGENYKGKECCCAVSSQIAIATTPQFIDWYSCATKKPKKSKDSFQCAFGGLLGAFKSCGCARLSLSQDCQKCFESVCTSHQGCPGINWDETFRGTFVSKRTEIVNKINEVGLEVEKDDEWMAKDEATRKREAETWYAAAFPSKGR